VLGRDIRSYAASLFASGMERAQADLVASLIEEADFAASFGETLHQVARRVQREQFSPEARIPGIRPDNTLYNDQIRIPTLDEVTALVKAEEARTGREIGVVPRRSARPSFSTRGSSSAAAASA
jgi:hypothetical protein